ncbi:DUF1214 domain-containing protein [Nocardia grenadensis]|uniref:DUF1214 domain-containing protein n=1 Tax=Nocardia grenadensis TaxID=931537 RepID=UPI0007A3D4B1|nr:DUF1214 domain-containing protein [Nocardia grenadensis]
MADSGAPVRGVTPAYARTVARTAYLWGWPLVNMHNRRVAMNQLAEPGLMAGVVPAGPPGTLSMLGDYLRPEERLVACPDQDVVHGFGVLDARLEPAVVQVPEFGDRFWVYRAVDQRTDSFARLGAVYRTAPGFYLLAHESWTGTVPAGITEVFRYDTRCAAVLPRVFLDDTARDRALIAPLVDRITMYPLSEFDGRVRIADRSSAPAFGAGSVTRGRHERQWVDPEQFFCVLGEVLDEVPARPGEQGLYARFRAVLAAAAHDRAIAEVLREAAVDTDAVVGELFEFRNIGIPVAAHWTTPHNGAAFGADYLSRTALAKTDIFAGPLNETAYFYQDLDAVGDRLHGGRAYTVHFPAGQLPPVRGIWSLTVYNSRHFLYSNELDRYSLGTRNQDLTHGDDGSLTLIVGGAGPSDPKQLANWLPAPDGHFSLVLRAYWPVSGILDGSWSPPAVTPQI